MRSLRYRVLRQFRHDRPRAEKPLPSFPRVPPVLPPVPLKPPPATHDHRAASTACACGPPEKLEDAAMNVLNRVRTLAVVPLLLIPFAAAVAQGAAQTGTIAGKVTDDNGAPIAGAQLGVQGTTAGAQTSTNGEYVHPPGARWHPNGPGADAGFPARLRERHRRAGSAGQPRTSPFREIRCNSRPWSSPAPRHPG